MDSGELKVEVPLAIEESDCDDIQDFESDKKPQPPNSTLEGGRDSMAASLEDLVNSFDDKLKKCFQNYQEQVEDIAPVQVRSYDEILNECQVWWTITGNFNNVKPFDWSKSISCAKQIEALNLGPRPPKTEDYLESEDDIVASDLDMHKLILSSSSHLQGPVKTAEEVIKEIDDIIEEDDEEYNQIKDQGNGLTGSELRPSMLLPVSARLINQALQGRELSECSTVELNSIHSDIEVLVRQLSEELISDLSAREELEYEKELKNNFISVLLSIQNKRRQIGGSKPNGGPPILMGAKGSKLMSNSGSSFKYLTTVIPYTPEKGPPQVPTLQILVKILKAINDDSPAVPTLLTDYILKVLCPT